MFFLASGFVSVTLIAFLQKRLVTDTAESIVVQEAKSWFPLDVETRPPCPTTRTFVGGR